MPLRWASPNRGSRCLHRSRLCRRRRRGDWRVPPRGGRGIGGWSWAMVRVWGWARLIAPLGLLVLFLNARTARSFSSTAVGALGRVVPEFPKSPKFKQAGFAWLPARSKNPPEAQTHALEIVAARRRRDRGTRHRSFRRHGAVQVPAASGADSRDSRSGT